MRSNIALGVIVAFIVLCSCQDAAIVVWERDGTIHGLVRELDPSLELLRPLANVSITPSSDEFQAITNSSGEWTASITTLSVPTTIRYVCSGYDTAYIVQYEWNSGRDNHVQDVTLTPTIVDTLRSFHIKVDSISPDSMWLSVDADVPDSVPFVTICFYDTLETDDATVKKWSAVFGTYIVIPRSNCNGRKLALAINSTLYEMSIRDPMYAAAAIGGPRFQYVYNNDTHTSELYSITGMGPLNSWVQVIPR